ncbi:MAG TPA: hypothetical protein PK264_12590 [Hyphomicrobiaceae bacterium]|nr:hypothetical protein [Hyphomicrobiaceae bacterium]
MTGQRQARNARQLQLRSIGFAALVAALNLTASTAAAQSAGDAAYERRCSKCHGALAEFAKSDLEVRDGVLVGRQSHTAVAEYLKNHGRARASEISALVERLRQVLEAGAGVPKT